MSALDDAVETAAHNRTMRRARDLYSVYCASSGGLNYQGKPCPTWDNLPEAIRGHWYTVVLRTLELANSGTLLGNEAREEPGGYVLGHITAPYPLVAWRRYNGVESPL